MRYGVAMTSEEELNKLFEAALGEKKAPSRYGTPEEQKKFSPVPVYQQQETPPPGESKFQAAPVPAPEYTGAPANVFQAAPNPGNTQPVANAFQAAPSQQPQAAQKPTFAAAPMPAEKIPDGEFVQLDDRGEASLDTGISAELGAIMDAKVARAKRRRRRGLIFMSLFFVGVTGGAAGWVVTNPERFDAMKKVVAEIKSVGDIQGMVDKYQKALDKVAVRSEQITDATIAMGVDPASADEMADQGFDAEMRAMMGEDGGPTTAARNAKLMEKFKHVQEGGSLIKGAEEPKDGAAEAKAEAEAEKR